MKKNRKSEKEHNIYEKSLRHYNMGVHLLDKDKVQGAIKEFLKALEYEPDMPEALSNLGYIFHHLGEKDKAYLFYRRCFEKLDEIIKARDIVDKKMDLPEECASMLASAGISMMENEDPDAKRCLEMAVKIGPENWATHYNLGCYYYANGLIEDALRECITAYRLNRDDADVVRDLSTYYNILGMEEESVEMLEEYLKNHPPEPYLLANLATAYGNLNRIDDANNVCEQWLMIEPDSPSAHAGLALGYAILGRKEDAYREIATALKLNEKLHDELAEEWIKSALEILENSDDNLYTLTFFFLLLIMKARGKMMQKWVKR